MKKTTSFVGYLSLFIIIFYPADQLMGDIIKVQNYEKYSPMRYILILYPIFTLSLFQKNKKLYIYKHLIIFSILLFWLYLSSIWAISSVTLSLLYSSKVFLLLSFVFSSVYLLGNKITLIPRILFYYITLSGVLSLYIILSTDIINQNLLRLSFKSVGVNALMISLGYSIIIGTTYLLFFKENSPYKKIIVLCSIIITAFVIFQGGTRSAFWGLFLSLFVSYIYIFNKTSLKNKVLLAITLLFLFFSRDFLIDESYFSESLWERMLIFDKTQVTENSRLNLWRDGIDWYSMNILGSGAGNEHFVYNTLGYGGKDEAHNTFISMLIQANMVGFALLVMALIWLGLDVLKIKNIQYKFLATTMFLFLAIQLFKGSFFQTRLFWQPVFFLLLMVELDRNTKKSNNIKKG